MRVGRRIPAAGRAGLVDEVGVAFLICLNPSVTIDRQYGLEALFRLKTTVS